MGDSEKSQLLIAVVQNDDLNNNTHISISP